MKYILHVDGDNFFASCLSAHNPKYRNKPIVVGRERGMAVAVSKEAKVLGVTRGMPIFHILKNFPEVIVLDGDYPLFSRFSKHMYAILSNYSMYVEHYSVDECFADVTAYLTHTQQLPHTFAREVQNTIEHSLDISVSVGIGNTKTRAKLFSTHQKPHGCLAPTHESDVLHIFQETPIERIWGIGHAHAIKLRVHGYATAHDFITKPLPNIFPSPVHHTREELMGISMFPINTKAAHQQSLTSSRSFHATDSRETVSQELKRHALVLGKSLRKKNLLFQEVTLYVITKERALIEKTFSLHTPTQLTPDILSCVFAFHASLPSDIPQIRTTGITLQRIREKSQSEYSLFHEHKFEKVLDTVDALERAGMTITLGSCL